MLPWRVQLQRVAQGLRENASFRNRVLAFLLALAFLIAAFSTGLEVNIRFGRTGSSELAVASDAGPVAQGAEPAGPGTTSSDVAATTTGEPSVATSAAAAPAAGPAKPAAGASAKAAARPVAPKTGTYEELLAGQLKAFTAVRGDCAGATLRATDRGVTAKQIKIGWLIPNLNELKAAGFEVGLAGDWDRIIEGWIKELNRLKTGCRTFTAVKEIFDVLSVDDMLAKCKAMVEDHKVFAVLTPGGYDSVGQLCIARDGKTPFINPEPEPEGWYKQARPYLWNMLMTKDRMHRNHVRWLVESKSLTRSKTVGVVYHDIPNVGPSVRNALLTELRKHGIAPKRITALSADTEQAVVQINQVVVDFQQQGIDYVFMPMNLIFKSQFQQQAEKQSYFPSYTDSDHYFGCFDFVTTTYSDRAWDRTRCVSAADVAGLRTADAEKLADVHPLTKYADQVYKRAWPDGYDRNGQSDRDTANTQRALFAGTGEQVLLFKQALDRIGVDITRAKWGASMGETGSYCTVVRVACLTFGPSKWDGPNMLTVVRWHAEASNGYEARRYQRIVPPFRAYY